MKPIDDLNDFKKWKFSINHEEKRFEFVTLSISKMWHLGKMCHFGYVKNVSLRVCRLLTNIIKNALAISMNSESFFSNILLFMKISDLSNN